MSRTDIVSEVLSLPDRDQKKIYAILDARWGANVTLSPAQERELDRRIETFEREGSKGERWEVVEKQLRRKRS
jgi:hypothetical protein